MSCIVCVSNGLEYSVLFEMLGSVLFEMLGLKLSLALSSHLEIDERASVAMSRIISRGKSLRGEFSLSRSV